MLSIAVISGVPESFMLDVSKIYSRKHSTHILGVHLNKGNMETRGCF